MRFCVSSKKCDSNSACKNECITHEANINQENKLNTEVKVKKKKIRRGRNRKKQVCEKWVIYHANIRGFKSKSVSLNSILDNLKPNVITLNEHGLKNRQKLVIDNFNSYNKN